MSESPKTKTVSGTAIPIKEAPPVSFGHDNEVFGNPKSFPFLWKQSKRPNTNIPQPDPEFPTTPTVKPK